MKRLVFFICLSLLGGAFTYQYLYKNNSIYSATLPANYESFEKDMFNTLIKLNKEEKDLLLNYSLRFKKNPSPVTVREAINNEKAFEKSNEGTVFFSRLREEEKKNSLIEEVSGSAFVTFVDFSIEANSINIIFSLKNKSPYIINGIYGDCYFAIGTDKFTTRLEFNTIVPATATVQVIKKFNFSEFPALKDMSKNSIFKMNIRQITFTNANTLIINR